MWNSNFTLLGTTKLLFNAFGSGVYHSGESRVFNNIKFQFNTGNILIGSATLYGRKI
jgi:diketogulonate reductase-like aldo/keto reductase